jgi:hypothetical protein
VVPLLWFPNCGFQRYRFAVAAADNMMGKEKSAALVVVASFLAMLVAMEEPATLWLY